MDAAAATEPFGHEKRLLLLVVTAVAVTHVSVPDWLTVLTMGGVLSALALAGHRRERWSWIALALVMTSVVSGAFTLVGNHIFLLMYSLWAVVIHIDDEARMQRTMRWLVVLVMGIAALQKVIHPYFMSGDALAWYAASGQSFSTVVAWIDPEWTERVQRNMELARQSLGHTPAVFPAFVPGGGFIVMTQVMAWLVFLVEAMVALMWIVPKRPFALHVTLAFVWATYLIRDEVYFFALLTLLSLIAHGSPKQATRKAAAPAPDTAGESEPSRPAVWWVGAGTIVYMVVCGIMGIRPVFLR